MKLLNINRRVFHLYLLYVDGVQDPRTIHGAAAQETKVRFKLE